VRTGEFEEVRLKLTSGIGSQHKKGGSSSNRFRNIREDEIDIFFKKVVYNMKSVQVSEWKFEGEKNMVKRFEEISK
jgi:peptide subunit release factor 1 (eRF1)